MNKLARLVITGIFLSSIACGVKSKPSDGSPTAEERIQEITQMDDSLKIYYQAIMQNGDSKIPQSSIQKAIDLQMAFYYQFPKHEFAAEALDKAQQLYLQQKEYVKSANVCDTLIANYPNYKQLKSVLISAASTYDFMLRDTIHAKQYYQRILNLKKLDPETKQTTSFRIKHLDMTLEEMIEFQIKLNSKK
jgi:tetratricopeptide (TPR) repeat protein